MQNRKKSTSNHPSTPSPPRDIAGHSDGDGSSGDTRPNAFDPEFLRRRHADEEEPLAAVEAESRGPWIVVAGRPSTPAGARDSRPYRERWEVYRSWEDPETDRPTAAFRFREQAWLYAAALEVGGRGSGCGQWAESPARAAATR